MAYNPATKSKQFLYGENEWIFSIKCGVQLIVLNVVNMMEMERKTTPGLRSNTSVYFPSLLLITSGTECVCVFAYVCLCVCASAVLSDTARAQLGQRQWVGTSV